MIFFDAKKIQNTLGRSPRDIILILRSIMQNNMPKNKYDPLLKYYYKDFSGKSYLINPEFLVVYAFKYTNKEIMEYILLAARRNYGNYIMDGDASLDFFHSPVGEVIINNNRLLKLVDGRIHFYYEEVLSRRNRLWH